MRRVKVGWRVMLTSRLCRSGVEWSLASASSESNLDKVNFFKVNVSCSWWSRLVETVRSDLCVGCLEVPRGKSDQGLAGPQLGFTIHLATALNDTNKAEIRSGRARPQLATLRILMMGRDAEWLFCMFLTTYHGLARAQLFETQSRE